MINRLLTLAMLLVSLPVAAMDTDGIVKLESAHDVSVTADRLVAALEDKRMKIFARINHGKGAAGVGVEIPPTELVIFGNPKIGAPLQQCARSVAIDLPQKALIWQDASGTTWLGYNDPAYRR